MPKVDKPKRFVLTGTSGTGKSTLIDGLRGLGYNCFEEPGRKVLNYGSDAAKREPDPFIEEMLAQSLSDYREANQLTFYDRGLPDIVAYADRFKVASDECLRAAQLNRYEETVFVAPPWKEIFVNDEVRTATFDVYLQFHESILKIYAKLKYSVCVLPKVSVSERIQFIESATVGI
ncbi:MAG: AAA family ATPase [Pseudomonadales bacterium]